MIKNIRTAAGMKEFFMPGEIEIRLIKERRVTGLDFSDALEAELTDLARQCGALGKDGTLADLPVPGQVKMCCKTKNGSFPGTVLEPVDVQYEINQQ